jgi:hypothetical protein
MWFQASIEPRPKAIRSRSTVSVHAFDSWPCFCWSEGQNQLTWINSRAPRVKIHIEGVGVWGVCYPQFWSREVCQSWSFVFMSGKGSAIHSETLNLILAKPNWVLPPFLFSCRWIVQICTIQRQLKRNEGVSCMEIFGAGIPLFAFGWMYKEGWNEAATLSIVFGWESTGGEVNTEVIFGGGVIPKNRGDGDAPDSSYFDFKPNTP